MNLTLYVIKNYCLDIEVVFAVNNVLLLTCIFAFKVAILHNKIYNYLFISLDELSFKHLKKIYILI